jgi:hypothetical protein
MPQPDTRRQIGRVLGAAVLILAGLAAYGAVALNTLRNGHTTFEEIGYLIRSWWYATGTVAPYSGVDATWHMPFYFYGLGWWQMVAGVGHYPSRLLSVGLGLASAALLFLICRRLTGNIVAAAGGVLVFLATPATAYAFSLATPTALLSTLHLALIGLIVTGLGRPRTWATVLFGLICVAIVFTRENLLLGLVVLIPLYIAAIGRERRLQSALLAAALVAPTAAVLLIFPTELTAIALHLPVISPTLSKWGLLPADFGLIDQGTTGLSTVAPAFTVVRWPMLIDTLVLPFAGTLVLSVALFLVTGRALRVLWIAPAYFLWLIAAHVFGTAGFCDGCMVSYTPTFVAAGALTAALTLATAASFARRHDIPPMVVIFGGAILAAAMSTFAPTLARTEAYRYYPASQLAQTAGENEVGDMDLFARWLKTLAPPREPILVISTLPALPYAAFLAGQTFPPQALDLVGTRRTIKPRIIGATREAVQAAVEAQSLWTEDTLRRWLQRDFELVLVQRAPETDQALVVAELAQRFDVLGSQSLRGQTVTLYKRKAEQ